MSELKFLGHIISAEGIKPDPDKVKAIADALVPRDQVELRSFLGSIIPYTVCSQPCNSYHSFATAYVEGCDVEME